MRESFLPYCRPAIGQGEIESVVDALRNGWLTTGPRTAEFERRFGQISGIPHAVALNSCTAGMHLAMIALGAGPGDEIVMPSLTFAAGAQCALEIGARPVFCDVERETFAASVRTIAEAVTPRTKIVVAMPYAGRPQGIADICEFARSRNIAVLEDAAHAAGTLDEGRWPGALSDAAVFSFYATKNIAAGEGGMLLTQDERLAARVRSLSLHGMTADAWQRYAKRGTWRYDIVEPGYKYNLADLLAAVGLAQLDRLEELQKRRDAIAARYLAELGRIDGIIVQPPVTRRGDRASWCMFAIAIDESRTGVARDEFVDRMRDCNVGTSVHYIPTHLLSAYRRLLTAPLPATDWLAARICSLPLYPSMSDRDVDDVLEAVHTSLRPRSIQGVTEPLSRASSADV